MQHYLKFLFLLVFNFCFNNKGKLLIIASAIISYNYAGTFPDDVGQVKVVKYQDFGDELKYRHVYFYHRVEDSEIKLDFLSFDTPQKIENGKVTYTEYNDLNNLMWFLFGVSCFVLFTISVMDDDDINWNLKEVWYDSLESMIYSEFEEGKYYYMSFGRLLYKSDTLISPRMVIHYSDIRKLSHILSMPKFKTKSYRREDVLKDLGI